MNKNEFYYGAVISLSETSTYIELVSRLCFYDRENLNLVALPYDESSLEKAQTLIDMPVVAKYTTNAKGEATFRGHEVSYDKNNEIYFGTESIGVHVAVDIHDDTVVIKGEELTLPCLFATYRIWKRNKNMVDAAKRLFDEGKLYSSWELQVISRETKDNIEWIDDYVFLANCLLGYDTGVRPAYGNSACALEMSSSYDEYDILVAEALAKDKIDNINNNKEDNVIVEGKDNILTSDGNVAETEPLAKVAEQEPEVSALTVQDIRRKLYKVIGGCVDICNLFPADGLVWVKDYDTYYEDNELDYVQYAYHVENNEVILDGEPEKITLMASPREINTLLSQKNNAIVEMSSTIKTLSGRVEELEVCEKELNTIKQAELEAEKQKQKDELSEYAIKSGYITSEEVAEDETIKGLIESIDKNGIKAIIADRVVSSVQVEEKPENVEEKPDDVQVNIASITLPLEDQDDENYDPNEVMKDYFNN